MFKKLFLIFLLLFNINSIITITNADDVKVTQTAEEKKAQENNAEKLKERDEACKASGNCLDKDNFTIPVSSMFNF
jgi:ArsR family metal-binding transcriptional regulator